MVFDNSIEVLLYNRPFNKLTLEVAFGDGLKGNIDIGYLRAGDRIFTGDDHNIIIWYQDGTKSNKNSQIASRPLLCGYVENVT